MMEVGRPCACAQHCCCCLCLLVVVPAVMEVVVVVVMVGLPLGLLLVLMHPSCSCILGEDREQSEPFVCLVCHVWCTKTYTYCGGKGCRYTATTTMA